MVLTIDPVSKRHKILWPPISMSVVGQLPISEPFSSPLPIGRLYTIGNLFLKEHSWPLDNFFSDGLVRGTHSIFFLFFESIL